MGLIISFFCPALRHRGGAHRAPRAYVWSSSSLPEPRAAGARASAAPSPLDVLGTLPIPPAGHRTRHGQHPSTGQALAELAELFVFIGRLILFPFRLMLLLALAPLYAMQGLVSMYAILAAMFVRVMEGISNVLAAIFSPVTLVVHTFSAVFAFVAGIARALGPGLGAARQGGGVADQPPVAGSWQWAGLVVWLACALAAVLLIPDLSLVGCAVAVALLAFFFPRAALRGRL